MVPWTNEEDTMHPPRVGPNAPDRNSNIKGGVAIVAAMLGLAYAAGAATIVALWVVIG